VFVRCHPQRMDVLRVLVIGPEGTPYENGCFVFDCYLPADYPNSPPMCKLRTTGGGTVRFNPNLYNCGKVCLSLLGTWSGEPWNAKTSTLLQLFVSIQSLILVPHPYFNEPGYEFEQGTPDGAAHSKAYNDDLLPHTLAFAMTEQLAHPDPAVGDLCAAHLFLRRSNILQQCDRWLKSIAPEFLPALEEQVKQLKQQLQKLELNPPALVRDYCKATSRALPLPGKLLVSVFCQTRPGQNLFLSGSSAALGGWEATSAVPMRWTDGHLWLAVVDIVAGQHELKFFMRDATGAVVWDAGANRKVTIKANAETVLSMAWQNSPTAKSLGTSAPQA